MYIVLDMRVTHHTISFLAEVHDHWLQASFSYSSPTTSTLLPCLSLHCSSFSAPQVETSMLCDRAWQMQCWRSTRIVCQTGTSTCSPTLSLIPPSLSPTLLHFSILLLFLPPPLPIYPPHLSPSSKDPPPTIQPDRRGFRQ